jgi:hypothetical protein
VSICILTAALFHLELFNPQQTIQLLKNLAITGGLLPYVFVGRAPATTGQTAGAGAVGRV